VEANAGVPHPVGFAVLARYAFRLGAYCQTSVEGIYTSELILQSFSIRKRHIEIFITLSKRASSLNLNTSKHSFSDIEESESKGCPTK
jgi:hypothetical protein